MEDTLELDLFIDGEEPEEEDTIDDDLGVLGPAPAVEEPHAPARATARVRSRPLLLVGGLLGLLLLAACAIAAVVVLPPLLRAPDPGEDPTPAATHGILLVEIEPAEAADAAILLDGVPIQVPFPELSPGIDHALFVQAEGFLPFEDTFRVEAGERYRVKAILLPEGTEEVTDQAEATTPEPVTAAPVDETPAIIWRSSPGNAQVIVDGQTLGRTPYRMENGAVGQTYRATFKLEGYQDAGASGVFPGQGSVSVRASLQKIAEPSLPGYLTINATPWANVYVDGRSVGQTPIGNLQVEPGPHVVRLVCPPLEAEKTINVTVGAGERKPVSADLED